MPSASAEFATSTPTAPSPNTPSVRPGNSNPTNWLLPRSTASLIAWSSPARERANDHAGQILRAATNRPARTNSLTAFAFAPGALNTGTPRLLSSATGMLLTPAPARAIASTEGEISMLCISADAPEWPRGRSRPGQLGSGHAAGARARGGGGGSESGYDGA